MNSTTLAARIGTLTHCVDRLEQLAALLDWGETMDTRPLWGEIAILHALIDQLNLDYEEALDREQDHAFEAVGG